MSDITALPPGLSSAVPDWLAAQLPSLRLPASFARMPGGRSNLTFVVTDARGARWVLRRPPLGKHPATAHDVIREARLLRAVAGGVPVPGVVATCEDTSVTEAPFIVLELLDGHVLRDPDVVRKTLAVAARAPVGPALIDAMAAMHSLDPARLGLGDMATRRDHIARALRRWHANWRQVATRELPDLERTHELLAKHIPEQRWTGIVHGDFRLDNCLLDTDGHILGILDWELTTVGDPLADLGHFLVYWSEPGDERTALSNPPTSAPGFSSREELCARYFATLGRAPADMDYYLAFGWWKTACILEGVYARMLSGVMDATDRTPESFGEQAAGLAEEAVRYASRIG